ncbi:hypothetical protein [Stieleria neptunia]|uniref:hypothetical protein n=1 Tax=Stieleria neptunia TaxID=2527979 RepID=UPI0011A8B1CA|nr:hypothetical protein [Stieleria neptunia]
MNDLSSVIDEGSRPAANTAAKTFASLCVGITYSGADARNENGVTRDQCEHCQIANVIETIAQQKNVKENSKAVP